MKGRNPAGTRKMILRVVSHPGHRPSFFVNVCKPPAPFLLRVSDGGSRLLLLRLTLNTERIVAFPFHLTSDVCG